MSTDESSEKQAENDVFLTVSGPVNEELKIQGSRFLSYVTPVADASGFMDYLETIRKEHHSATHHCYAYRIGMEQDHFRYSDDGEPNGTAGKRILGAIDRHGLTDSGIIVVRYFGGTKLGVGGLGRAYADSAEQGLNAARIEKRILTTDFVVEFPFDITSKVHHLLERHGAEILDRVYSETVTYSCTVRRSRVERCTNDLVEETNHIAAVTPLPV